MALVTLATCSGVARTSPWLSRWTRLATRPAIPSARGRSRARAAVTAMCDALRATEKGLPRGRLYVSDAGEGEAGYVTDGLLAAFLGDGKTVPWQAEAAVSYAFYLSYTSPVTLAVFRCGTVGGAEDLALLLSERLRLYRVHWAGSEWEEAVAGAAVEVSGSDVLLAVAPDGRALIRRGREGLR